RAASASGLFARSISDRGIVTMWTLGSKRPPAQAKRLPFHSMQGTITSDCDSNNDSRRAPETRHPRRERTIQRCMRCARPPGKHGGQSWRTFLRNHTVWACDYLQVYDVWFRPIFAFFIVDVNAKHVVQVAVTLAPTQAWTAQQLRNAMPFGDGPQFLIRDRDDKFGAVFDRVAAGAGARVVRTAVQAPLMNAFCER